MKAAGNINAGIESTWIGILKSSVGSGMKRIPLREKRSRFWAQRDEGPIGEGGEPSRTAGAEGYRSARSEAEEDRAETAAAAWPDP